MRSLSISRAWDEANRFARAELPLLVPVALAFLVLPNLVSDLLPPIAQAGGATAGPWIILIPLSALLQLLGQLSIVALASGTRLSVGEAVRLGAQRLGPAIGVTLLGLVVVATLMIPLAPFLQKGAATVQPSGPLLLYMLALSLAMFWAGVRLFALATLLVMAERLGVIAAFRRNYALTAGVFWRLLGFLMLFLTFYIVVLWATSAGIGSVLLLLGKLTGLEQAGTVIAALASNLVSAALLTWLTLLLVAIWRQLAGLSEGI